MPELLLYCALSQRDQRSHVGRGRAAEVDDDVGVEVGDLRTADRRSLEAALIDQSAGADAFDLPEDGARARVDREPRVAGSAPAEVLLMNAVQDVGVARRQPEGRGEHVVGPMMKDRIVVAELHVVGAYRLPL